MFREVGIIATVSCAVSARLWRHIQSAIAPLSSTAIFAFRKPGAPHVETRFTSERKPVRYAEARRRFPKADGCQSLTAVPAGLMPARSDEKLNEQRV